MEYYKRNLPHWQPSGAEFFITFRLAGTLPKEAIQLLKEKQKQFYSISQNSKKPPVQKAKFADKIFEHYEKLLDSQFAGPTWLKEKDVAKIVTDSLHFYDQDRYDLYAYTIMSNHVHLVLNILKRIIKQNILSLIL